MKLSEYKDEAALELLADLIEPASAIFADEEIKAAYEKKESKAAMIGKAIKRHKPEVMRILAALDGVPVEEYHCNILTLPVKLLQILNDPDLTDFFSSAAQTKN